ncbi:hypothetical protein [Vibrio navarrensis]|uniref:hypothetical protein n=1 Tax=Vibrio navarrensis TaxID=29495 RepID=UPI001867DC6C|nr:hypothetical protein [Vibrio navarrensis]MBE3654117.1 hypothetical protein [Vibrio navarrensis]
MKFFTITARNYLSLALSLGDSISRHHPDADFIIVVADGLEGIDASLIKHQLIPADTIISDDHLYNHLSFKYNITEFCTSIKPFVFDYLYERTIENEMIFYFDPDTYLFSTVDEITEGHEDKNLFLTPHIIDCSVEYIHTYPEYKHLWEGIFNLGFCGIRKKKESKIIIDWWKKRLIDFCYADYFEGLHTDQKWMDYAPVYFSEQLCVVKHFGCNVSHWNIDERNITKVGDVYFSNAQPLIFFHFSGFDFNRTLLTKHVDESSQTYLDNSDLNFIANYYRNVVRTNGYEKFISLKYKYNFFSDGTPISSLQRRLFRKMKLGQNENPFDINASVFKVFLSNNLLSSDRFAVENYSVRTVNNLDNKIKKVETLLKLTKRVLGMKYYTYLIKLFSRYGRFENHTFLISDKE